MDNECIDDEEDVGEEYKNDVANEAAEIKAAELRVDPPSFEQAEVNIYTLPGESLLLDCAPKDIHRE